MTGGTICIAVMLTLAIVSLLINKRVHAKNRLHFISTFRQNENAEVPSNLTQQRIVEILDSKGLKPFFNGHWIVFVFHEQEYAINTSGYPIFSLLKQTALDGFPIEPGLHEEVAIRISGEIIMTKIHIKDNPSRRVVFQLDAVENCPIDFEKRLDMYIDIINEAEIRFFKEIVDISRQTLVTNQENEH